MHHAKPNLTLLSNTPFFLQNACSPSPIIVAAVTALFAFRNSAKAEPKV